MHIGKEHKIYLNEFDPDWYICPRIKGHLVTCEIVETCRGKCEAIWLLEKGELKSTKTLCHLPQNDRSEVIE